MGAGAWEQPPTVLVGLLHTELVPLAWAFGLRNLQVPAGAILPVAGRPFDHARNEICMAALDHNFDYVFFLDSDVIPPADAIPRLIAHNLPVVSGMYCRRSPPHAVPVMMKNGQWHTSFKPGQLVEVDVVGAGCLLIRRDLLLALPPIDPVRSKHWFDWRVDMQGKTDFPLSEDYSFNFWCKKQLGISVFVDTSVACRHVGLAEATYGQFLPCNTTPHT